MPLVQFLISRQEYDLLIQRETSPYMWSTFGRQREVNEWASASHWTTLLSLRICSWWTTLLPLSEVVRLPQSPYLLVSQTTTACLFHSSLHLCSLNDFRMTEVNHVAQLFWASDPKHSMQPIPRTPGIPAYQQYQR